MKLHFFSLTKHQYRYFETLRAHLDVVSNHTFFPHFIFSLKPHLINSQEILETKYREIHVKYPNPLHRFFYRLLLKIEVFWVANVVYHQLIKHHPDFLVLWNGKKFHQAIAVKVAQSLNIRCVYFENGVLPNTTTMDFQGVNASNSLPRNAGFYQDLNYPNLTLPTTLEVRTAKKEKQSHSGELPENYIFVPFQVAYDTQIIQHSPWIKDMVAFFDIITWLSERLTIHFVIKEHPSDRVNDYSHLHQHASANIHFSTQNTQILIENAAAVMTINSSVAMESLLFEKRVIVLGEAFFAIEGIVKVATSKEQILEILQNLDTWTINGPLRKNFLYYLYYEYLLPTNWRHPDRQHYQAIEKKLKAAQA